MPVESISSERVAEWLNEGGALVVLDVRLEEDFQRGHVPGAKSNCVFEVAFGDRLGKVAPDKSVPVCVYGADGESMESAMAAEKLERAGYEKVLNLEEGLAGWSKAGRPVEKEGDAPKAVEPKLEGERAVDLKESRIEWTGRNLLNKHSGTIGLKSGVLRFEDGQLVSGEFVVDVRKMECADLKGHEMHDVLIAHLHSDDFFDVERYPEARFVITDAEKMATVGAPNLMVCGNLTIKGVTLPLGFSAVAGVTPEGKPAAQAVVAFDRTLWNVIYGSGKLFRNLGGHLVNDLIEVQLRVVAN